jgi:hypothetical protein
MNTWGQPFWSLALGRWSLASENQPTDVLPNDVV